MTDQQGCKCRQDLLAVGALSWLMYVTEAMVSDILLEAQQACHCIQSVLPVIGLRTYMF